MKDYLLALQHACADETTAQDAIEWAVFEGRFKLSGILTDDVLRLAVQLDRLVAAYQHTTTAALTASYEASGLLEEILRPLHHYELAAATA